MDKPFPAYEGDEPYVFVCYAHADAAAVYRDIGWLNDHGANIWYDEGISPGNNWRATIGKALIDASSVLVYLSNSSLESDHCNREINLALDEGKTVVPVYLESVELTPDLKVGFNRVQALNAEKNTNHRPALLNALGKSGSVEPIVSPPLQSNRRFLGTSILAFFLAVATLLGLWMFFSSGSESTQNLPAENLYLRSFETPDVEEKVVLLEKALEYAPGFLDARAELGLQLISASEGGILNFQTYHQARNEALTVLASDPKHALATLVMARTYLLLDINAFKALESLSKAEKFGTEPVVVAVYKAVIYLNTANYDLAKETMEKAYEQYKQYPEIAPLLEIYARSLFLVREVDAAWAIFDEALRLDPRYGNAITYSLALAAEEKDALRIRKLIQMIPADALPQHAEPLLAAVEGNPDPLRELLKFWEANRDQYKIPAYPFAYGSWWTEDYEDHIRWHKIAEQEKHNLYWVNFNIGIKSHYWEKLEAWSVEDPAKIEYRRQLLSDHRKRIDRVTAKMVL